MDLKIILIYCFCDDFCRKLKHGESQEKMSQAEVIAFAITSALFFYGNHQGARLFMKEYGYMPHILSKSQLNRRLHQIDAAFWNFLLSTLSSCMQHFEQSGAYLIDSFPVPACDTPRINRAKIFQGKEYHGYNSSKQRYFYGLKVHMMTSTGGIPVEVIFTPGAEHDIKAFKRFSLDIPSGSVIYADRAYNNYEYEDFLKDHVEIHLIAQRRKITKRPLKQELRFIQSRMRKRIETTFSQITRLLPRSIHAVTSAGFEIKVFSFILAYTFDLFLSKKTALA